MAWWDREVKPSASTQRMADRENAYTGQKYGSATPTYGGKAPGTGFLSSLADGQSAINRAADNQASELQRLGGQASLDRAMQAELSKQQKALAASGNRDPTFNEFLATMGLGGGADLSGYNSMLDDLTAREGALGERKAENEAFIAGIIQASRTSTEERQAGLADITNTQLDNDSARRATEIDLIRGADDARLNTANEARAALGSTIGADLSSAVAQNQVGGVGATGAVADSDARILENLSSQQYSRQLAGLDPMQLMANRQLSNTYEDRLGALGSERSAIQGQMAAARASASSAASSARMNALGLYQQTYGQGEVPDAPGGLGVLQDFTGSAGQNTALYQGIYDNWSTLTDGVESYDRMNNKRNPYDVAREIINNNPGLDGAAMDFIAQLVQSNVG